jgi:site-specific DNA recombinase
MIAAIYARKSTEQAGVREEEKSVGRQVDTAKTYAARQGWRVADEYIFVDDGISGAEFQKRPGLTALLNALTPRPPFQVLVMSDGDRLGREQIETAFVLKRIAETGVRIFYSLENREAKLDDAASKFFEGARHFAADMEREKARQRTRDAMAQKAQAGYVTGGTVFGYDNIEIVGESGKRQHVERRIHGEQAAILRRIFEMIAGGTGFKTLAKTFNAEAVLSPRPRRDGRSRSWTASSIRAIVFNPLYTGRIVWGRTKKRDVWGRTKQSDRPETEWVKLLPREELRIVSEELWEAAHARIARTRDTYRASGPPTGRPPGGSESKYLLTGFGECARCRGSMVTASRASGSRRAQAYVCANHRERGNAVCGNRLHAPMEVADWAVLSAIEHDLLRPEVVEEALREAVRELHLSIDEVARRREELQGELIKLDGELARYAEAIATAGELSSIVAEMKKREVRRTHLKAELAKLGTRDEVVSLNAARVSSNLRERLADWQGLLHRQTAEARQMLRRLLVGRLVFTPREDEKGRYYEFAGQGAISTLLAGVVLPKVWWPQRDSNPCFSHDHVFASGFKWFSVAGPGAFALVEPTIEGPLRDRQPGPVATCYVSP